MRLKADRHAMELVRLTNEICNTAKTLGGALVVDGEKMDLMRQTLRYVAYQRLPLGNTVFETLNEDWQRRVMKCLEEE